MAVPRVSGGVNDAPLQALVPLKIEILGTVPGGGDLSIRTLTHDEHEMSGRFPLDGDGGVSGTAGNKHHP